MASLKTMAGDKNIPGVKKADKFMVDPTLVQEEEGFNLREEGPELEQHVEEFAQAYANGDYVPPWLVRTADDGTILLVDGHCRRRGALRAISRGAELPFVEVLPFFGNDEARLSTMLRSAEGLPFSPLEIAAGYLRFLRMGHDNKAISKKVRKTESHVEQMLVLARANSDVQGLVRAGKVAAHTAIEAVRAHGEGAGPFLQAQLEVAVSRGKTRVTSSAIRPWSPPAKVVSSLVTRMHSFAECLSPSARLTLAEVESRGDAMAGATVEVDAAAMLELLRAHGEIEAARAKRDERDRAAEARTNQMALSDHGEGVAGNA